MIRFGFARIGWSSLSKRVLLWRSVVPRRLVLCLVATILGCTESRTETRSFATAVVRVAPIADSVLASGRVHTVKSVDVSSQLSGRIDTVHVDYNDT